MSRPYVDVYVDVPIAVLVLAESKCQKRVPSNYTAKDIVAFYCTLQVVILKRPKINQAAWNKRLNAPKPVRKKKDRHRAR